MSHDLVSGVEDAIAVGVAKEGLLGVLDKVANSKGIPGGIPDGHPR